jgi:hypothetical protein
MGRMIDTVHGQVKCRFPKEDCVTADVLVEGNTYRLVLIQATWCGLTLPGEFHVCLSE